MKVVGWTQNVKKHISCGEFWCLWRCLRFGCTDFCSEFPMSFPPEMTWKKDEKGNQALDIQHSSTQKDFDDSLLSFSWKKSATIILQEHRRMDKNLKDRSNPKKKHNPPCHYCSVEANQPLSKMLTPRSIHPLWHPFHVTNLRELASQQQKTGIRPFLGWSVSKFSLWVKMIFIISFIHLDWTYCTYCMHIYIHFEIMYAYAHVQDISKGILKKNLWTWLISIFPGLRPLERSEFPDFVERCQLGNLPTHQNYDSEKVSI